MASAWRQTKVVIPVNLSGEQGFFLDIEEA